MTRNILLDFDRFDVYTNSFDYLNLTNLNELYLPILGMEPIFVYQYLYNLRNIKNTSDIDKGSISSILQSLSLSIDRLVWVFKNLESIGLIQSFINEDSTYSKLTFVLQKPLNFEEFSTNNALKSLLINKIGSSKFNELKYIFNSFAIQSKFKNVSENIDWLQNENNFVNYDIINFDKLENKVLLLTGKKISLSNIDKIKLISLYKESLLSVDELIKIIISNLILENDVYLINYNNIYKTTNYSVNLNNQKVVRNYKIFEQNCNIDSFEEVIKSYQSFNPENYFLSISKQEISYELQKVINILKTKYDFSNDIINLLIDYCLYKNWGRIEPNYIYSIAKTINNINLENLQEVIFYIQCINNNIKTNYDIIKQSKKQQLLNNNDISDIWGDD